MEEPLHESPEESHPGNLPDDVEYSVSAQRRNSFVFILNNSISYLIAPVIYIGVLHSAILQDNGYNKTTANLPETVFLFALQLPVVIAWIWPAAHHLRRMLVINYLFKAFAGMAIAAMFMLPPSWLVVGIVAYAAVVGVTNGVTNMCQWELIGRGMSPARRGWTLAMTFGFGPAFAVIGSCASQLILAGNFMDAIKIGPVPKPWCYVVLFGFAGPAMLLAAIATLFVHVPHARTTISAGPSNVFRGLRQFFTYRLIAIAACGFVLTSAGSMVMSSVGLLAVERTGQSAEYYTGIQLALRFGCKSLFGFALGWMLARYQAKLPVLATTFAYILGVAWALYIPGKWYLFSFGLLGAGELFYVYYLNYIVASSAPERIRENTAYTNSLYASLGFMPVLYGLIADHYQLNTSLAVAMGIFITAFVTMLIWLPRRPSPPSWSF